MVLICICLCIYIYKENTMWGPETIAKLVNITPVHMAIYIIKFNIDPENHHLLVETNLPIPMTAGVYINFTEG